MDRWAWPTAVKVIVGIMVAGLVVGIVLLLVDQFELTGAFPPDTGDFVRDIQAGNEYFTARAPLFIAQSALFAIGFAALGLLGPLLARLARPGDSRGPILTGVLLLAGGLGLTAQLLWMAAHPVATGAQYCDCGFLVEELMSRLMTHNILQGVQTWLTNGAVLGASIGLVVAARPGVNAGMPVGWAYLGYLTALAAGVNVILWWFQFQSYPWNLVAIVIIAAILVPAWGIWLALRAEGMSLDDAAD
jgi:MFS family permease